MSILFLGIFLVTSVSEVCARTFSRDDDIHWALCWMSAIVCSLTVYGIALELHYLSPSS